MVLEREESDMIEILAYAALGALILFTSLVLWWFVRLAE